MKTRTVGVLLDSDWSFSANQIEAARYTKSLMFKRIQKQAEMTKKKQVLSNNQINFKSLIELCQDSKSSVDWLQQNKKILCNPQICSRGHKMKIQLSEKDYRSRCRKNGCNEAHGVKKKSFLWKKLTSRLMI